MNALTYRGSRFGIAWRVGWAGFVYTFTYPYPWHEPKLPLFVESARHGWSLFIEYLTEPPA